MAAIAGAGGLLALLLHQQTDGRVGDRFQRRPFGRVGEHVGPQACPVQATVRLQHRAEALGDTVQGRAAGGNHRAGGQIGVGHDAQRVEAPGHLAACRGNAAGQAT